MLPSFVNSLWSGPKPTDKVDTDTDVEMGVKNMLPMPTPQLPMPTPQLPMPTPHLPMPTPHLHPAQPHPLVPQNHPSQLEHNAHVQPLPETPINPPSGEPSQPEYDAHLIPNPLGSPFDHSPQARVDLSKVKLRGISAQNSRRRRGPQTPPRQREDTRKADGVSGRRTLADAEQVVVEKARLVEQDDFITRQRFEAKDGAMEALKKEADRLLKEKDDTIHTLRAAVDEYKEQLSGVGDQMKQLQEAVKRQQDELQAIQRRAELGMVINAGHGNSQPAPQVNIVVNKGLPKSQMALQVSTTVNEVPPNSLLAPQANTTVREGHPDSQTTPRVNMTVDEGPQNSQLAQQASTMVNEGPPNTRLAPQVRPNMATYRDGEDVFMDGESETSDEFLSHVKAGKRRENVESDDEILVITDDEVPSNSIPAPYKFSRPRGGTGPRLKLANAGQGVKFSQSSLAAKPQGHLHNDVSPPASTTLLGQTTEADARMVTLIARTVFDLLGERNVTPIRKKTAVISTEVKEPADRTRRPRRSMLAGQVRTMMNELMGIMKDADVVKITGPSIAEVNAFENETGAGPKLKPMRLYLDGKMKHPWNADLAEQFVSQFMSKFAVDENDEDDIWDLFKQRFLNLKRKVSERKLKEDEDEVGALQRVANKDKARLEGQRPNTRRGTLYQDRAAIAGENQKKADNTIDEVWDFLHKLVTMLHQEGMSSDESEEENGHPVYWVKIRQWRSAELIRYLHMIDLDANRTNAYGKTRPGNTPRVRKRRVNATRSSRRAVPGLPINFYDATWYATLQNRDKVALKAKPVLELHTIIPVNQLPNA